MPVQSRAVHTPSGGVSVEEQNSSSKVPGSYCQR